MTITFKPILHCVACERNFTAGDDYQKVSGHDVCPECYGLIQFALNASIEAEIFATVRASLSDAQRREFDSWPRSRKLQFCEWLGQKFQIKQKAIH